VSVYNPQWCEPKPFRHNGFAKESAPLRCLSFDLRERPSFNLDSPVKSDADLREESLRPGNDDKMLNVHLIRLVIAPSYHWQAYYFLPTFSHEDP